ncbi:MAG: hypothetical protein OEY23_06350 [Acidimicrobiia bacterium]|nr:hypothetical protein [Acidimicrobiia bacterium]
MTPTPTNALVAGLALVVCLVGAVDGVVSREWDFFALFLLSALLLVFLLARTNARRPAVPLRADLVDWLRDETALSGEPMGHLADRAVAAYRAGLTADEGAPARHG